MNAVLALPIIAPLVGAALTIMFRHSILQRIISFTALSISLISAIIITVDVSRDSDIPVSRLGGSPANIGITLVGDRLAAMFGGSDTIRDYIAFPKNNAGRDLMIDSPSTISNDQLNELGLEISLNETK